MREEKDVSFSSNSMKNEPKNQGVREAAGEGGKK